MISRVAILIALAACTNDVPTMRVSTTAMTSITVSPPEDGVPAEFGTYRWEVAQTPPGLFVAPLVANTATITITPPKRGTYVYDRWFVGDGSEQLSYHVIVLVGGALPLARVGGPMTVTVGQVATFDGSSSTSPEAPIEGYQWRLAIRPEQSAVTLENADQETVTFVPDVPGQYKVELRVFDGQLWSTPTSASLTAE